MKKHLLILLCFHLSGSAYSQPLFNKGFLWEVATDNVMATQHPGGDFFLYGGKWLPEGGYLAKLNTEGTLLWADKLYYSTSSEGAVPSSCVVDTTDNSLVFAVQAEYPNAGSMIKMDTSGNIIWNIDLDLPITNVVRSSDSNYIFLGRRDQAGAASDFDIFLFKISQSGSVIFSWHYVDVLPFHPYNFDDKMTYDLVQHPNGNTFALVAAAGNIFVMCFGPDGSVLWNTKYFSTGYINPYVITAQKWKLLLMPDHSLLVCGQQGNMTLPLKLMAFSLDTTGNVLWSKEYPSLNNTGLLNACVNQDSTVTLFGNVAVNSAAGIFENVFS